MVLLRVVGVDQRAARPDVVEACLRAVLPGESQHLRAALIDSGHLDTFAERLGDPGTDADDCGRLRHLPDRARRRDVRRRESILRGERVVGGELLRHRILERSLETRGEHGDERDERKADHQRGGGRRRSRRIAQRVPLRQIVDGAIPAERRELEVAVKGEVPHCPERERDREEERREGAHRPGRYRRDGGGNGPHDPRRDDRDGHEREEHAETDEQQPLPGCEPRADDTADHECGHRAGAGEQPGDRCEAGEPRRRQDCAFANRRDRRHAGRPDRRPQ